MAIHAMQSSCKAIQVTAQAWQVLWLLALPAGTAKVLQCAVQRMQAMIWIVILTPLVAWYRENLCCPSEFYLPTVAFHPAVCSPQLLIQMKPSSGQ
jgi:hypothetical protein